MDAGENGADHRLDGFNADDALAELRWLAAEVADDDTNHSGQARRMGALFDLLDHWLIVGQSPPADWRWPEVGVVVEHAARRQPKRTTRAQRHGTGK